MKRSHTKINLEKSKEFVSRGAERTKVREHPRTFSSITSHHRRLNL
nr:palindromic element RPE5 domain-containing protein [Rickettsia felis]